MADLDQAVLDNPAAQAAAASELRRQQFEQLRVEKLKAGSAVERSARARALQAARQKIISAGAASLSADAQSEISSVALQAWRTLWQQAHEIIEGLAFQFFLLGALLAGPLAALFLGLRYFLGNVLHGWIQIRRAGVEVPLVPPMTIVEQTYRGAKVSFILLISAVEWLIIIVAIAILVKPTLAVQLGLQALSQLFTGHAPITPQQ